MKIIHVADIHASKERLEQSVQIMDTLIGACKKKDIAYTLFCGDFWDKVVTNTQASGLTVLLEKMQALSTLTHVIMIYGTPSHEPDGSLELFRSANVEVIDTITMLHEKGLDILAIPEPRRAKFLGDSETQVVDNITSYLNKIGTKGYKAETVPLVVMYHGEVVGSRYQNGITAKSAIAISQAKLLSTGAVYIACGHIHMPQCIEERIVYSGSACPIDMGETHDAHYNIIDINNTSATYKEVSFGFPVNEIVHVDVKDLNKLMTQRFTGKNVKVVLATDKEVNVSAIKKQILKATKAAKLYLNIDMQKTTNVRSQEIVAQKKMVDKFITYASLNNIEITNTITKKLQDMEDTILTKYTFPVHSFELLSLSLRGAIGLGGREQLDLDFTQFHDGVIVFVGANGAGKSTVLENCHPYPQMLTRSGKLRDHFYLKDSFRKVVYKDEAGKYYRFTITMVASLKTGVTKYYAETSTDGVSWSAVAGVDGNLDAYEKYVTETFGDVALFLKTSFFAKEQTKGYPDIATATKGERAALFAKLAGQDYIATIGEEAKARAKDLQAKVDAKSELLGERDIYLAKEQEYRDAIETLEGELVGLQNDMTTKEADVTTLQKADAKYRAFVEQQRYAHDLIDQSMRTIQNNEDLIKTIAQDKKVLDFMQKHEHDIKAYSDALAQCVALRKTIDDASASLDTAIKYSMEMQKRGDEIETSASRYDSKVVAEQNTIAVLEAKQTKIDTVHCPTCGAVLSPDKRQELERKARAVQDEIDKHVDTLFSLQGENEKVLAELRKYRSEKATADSNIEKCRQAKAQQDAEYKRYSDIMNSLADYAPFCEYHAQYTEHDVRISRLQNENAELQNKVAKLQDTGVPPQDVTVQLQEASIAFDKARDVMQKAREDLAGYQATYKEVKNRIAKIKDAEVKISILQVNLNDFITLQKAFSPQGIQALELEAVVPAVAEVTNRILHASLGDKFNIWFETLRDAKTKGKQVEDFNIMATNTLTGRSCPIAMLSSGELIWVKQSLFFAFSAIRERNSGFAFKTRFVDESDGSLDGEMRVSYLKMINSSAVEGGANKTILVSHSQEIKDCAEQFLSL